MTLKHISFSDSPVEREFVKQAFKSGSLSPSVENIVKQASLSKNNYKPTQNLINDLFVLATGLRQTGLHSKAEELENKIILYKQAETHLYRALDEDGEDVIEFAHPDGPVEILPAEHGYGEMETTLSQHEKILEVLRKTPTGKIAQVLNQVNDILKVAQTPAATEDLPEELTLDEATSKKVEELNGFLAQAWPSIGTKIHTALTSANQVKFAASYVLFAGPDAAYTQFFAQQAKVPTAELQAVLKSWKIAYGASEPSAVTIQSKLAEMSREQMYAWTRNVDANLASQYFTGMAWPANSASPEVYAEYVRKSPQNVNNPNSIFHLKTGLGGLLNAVNNPLSSLIKEPYSLSEAGLAAAAAKIHQTLLSRFESLVTSKVAEANQNLAATEAELLTPLTELLSNKDINLSVAPKIKNSTSNILQALIVISDSLSQYLSGDLGKKLNAIFSNMTPAGSSDTGVFFAQLSEAQEQIANIKSTLTKTENLINKGDVIPAKETYQTIANNFKVSAQRLNAYVKQLRAEGDKTKSAEVTKYLGRLRRAAGIYKLVSGNVNQPFSNILGAVTKIFPKVTDVASLVQESESWNKGTVSLEKGAILKANLNKVADYGDDEALKGAAKPSNNSAKPTGSPANVSLTSEERDAVQGMQLALFTLGQYLMTYGSNKLPGLGGSVNQLAVSLMKTGKGLQAKATKNQFDGAWGANTASALSSAQKVIDAYDAQSRAGLGSLQLGPMLNQGSAATSAAQNNTQLLIQVIRGSFGGVSGEQDAPKESDNAGATVDNLPEAQSLTSTISPDLAIQQGSKIPVTLGNLKNLATFYQFLIGRDLETTDRSGDSESNIGYEGFSIKHWNGIIQWFKKRAVFKYNLFGQKAQGMEGYKQAAKAYYDAVANLEAQFKYLFTSLASRSKDKRNFGDYVVSSDLVAQMNQGSSSALDRNSRGGSTERNSHGPNGQISSRQQEAAGWRGSSEEGRSIQAPPSNEDQGSPVGEKLNLERLGILDDSVVYPQISYNQFRANAIDLARSLINEQAAGRPAVDQFQRFLVSLSSGIQQAAAEWARNGQATEEEVEVSAKWSQAWAQRIRQKMSEIQRWRQNGRG